MENKKNLIFASATFHPWNRQKLRFKKKDYIEREHIYWMCFKQLKRVVPDNFEVYIVDNSVRSVEELYSKELIDCLKNFNSLFLQEPKIYQTQNIGVAELRQLFYLYEAIDFSKYNKIAFLTSRRIITNPYVFEKTEKLKEDALICNPDFFYLSGKYQESEKRGMYSDMFFSMKSKVMIEYVKYSRERLEYLDKNMINSESNLYDFINQKNISYEFIETIGFLRYVYQNESKDLKDKFVFH